MIAGLEPCSFVDYPGELAAVLFCQGCNLRCRYCHNPALCQRVGPRQVPNEALLRFFESRRGKLTAVVASGGEPCLHEALSRLLETARSYGFAVKLDTNGTRPELVRDWVESGLIDYAAVDVKVAPETSSKWLCGVEGQAASALKTLGHILDARVPCEARTTVVRGLHGKEELGRIARNLALAGVHVWRLQPVRASRVLDTSVRLLPPGDEVLFHAVERAVSLGLDAALRT
jgi:pyruvate formate lyase activating enzyme